MQKSLCLTKISFLFVFISCGNYQNKLKDIKAELIEKDQKTYLQTMAIVDFGAIQLPGINAPIILPGKGNVGNFTMMGQLVSVELSILDLINVSQNRAYLPNGSIIPFIAENECINLMVGNTKLELYVLLNSSTLSLGISIPVKQLDGLGSKIGTTSLFPIFPIKNVLASVGIFTGPTVGENGMGLFFDLSSILNKLSSPGRGVMAMSHSENTINYEEVNQRSESQEQKLNKYIYKLNRRAEKLELH